MKAFFGRFSRRTWIILVVAVVVVAVVVSVLNARARTTGSSQYQTQPAQKGELVATVGATGSVRAVQSAVLNWQTTGTVATVNVKAGDTVKKGDVLAALSNTSLPGTVIAAEANLITAQKALDDLMHSDTDRANAWIALRDAQDAYGKANDYRKSLNGVIWLTRTTTKYFRGRPFPVVHSYRGYADPDTIAKADADLALKKAQLDDAQRAYDRLKNGPNQEDLAAAQAQVDAAQATVNTASIISPINGTVTQAEPLPGDQINMNQLAFRVDDLSTLLVDVQVSEVDINNVSLNQPATLTLDAIPNQTYHGEVVEVSQAGDTSSGAVNFTVTVQLTDADIAVKPGMTVAVNIVTKQIKDQLLVPNRAVRSQNGQRVVYILQNGQAKPVSVTLGASSDTESVVTGGQLKEGDLIVLNPPALFQNGPGGGFGGG
jgi:HlyD family secretion protein